VSLITFLLTTEYIAQSFFSEDVNFLHPPPPRQVFYTFPWYDLLLLPSTKVSSFGFSLIGFGPPKESRPLTRLSSPRTPTFPPAHKKFSLLHVIPYSLPIFSCPASRTFAHGNQAHFVISYNADARQFLLIGWAGLAGFCPSSPLPRTPLFFSPIFLLHRPPTFYPPPAGHESFECCPARFSQNKPEN